METLIAIEKAENFGIIKFLEIHPTISPSKILTSVLKLIRDFFVFEQFFQF